VLKFSEPPEARMPVKRWRLYIFKGEEQLEPLRIYKQSFFLCGKDRQVVDIPTDHPSCSRQHAVIQYRQITTEDEFGAPVTQIKPYLMDLESTNGSFINDARLEPRRYYEILEKDVLKFGNSTRKYVLLHPESKDSDSDDGGPG
jgi:smad nuclear-interacting protein 1